MTATDAPNEDARDLLGMRTNGALLVVGGYVLTMVIVATHQLDVVDSPLLLLLGLAVFTAAAFGVVRIPGDPLPPYASIMLTAAAPVGCALVLAGTPEIALSSLLFTWIHGAGTAVLAFLNVRGRIIAPWIGLISMIGVAATWAQVRGLSPMTAGLLVGIDAAPIIMSLMFALTLRPTARAVFTLRAQTTDQIARTAAASAADDERAAQSKRLNGLAGPLLARIAEGDALSAAERHECEVLEAHLRDQLRAPLLSRLGLDVAAYEARTRGVDVLLIDDTDRHDSDDSLDPTVLAVLRDRALVALTTAVDGQVYVRVSAPDRPIAASVLVKPDAGGSVRTEIAPNGSVVEFR